MYTRLEKKSITKNDSKFKKEMKMPLPLNFPGIIHQRPNKTKLHSAPVIQMGRGKTKQTRQWHDRPAFKKPIISAFRVPAGQDRRHIISFDVIKAAFVTVVNNIQGDTEKTQDFISLAHIFLHINGFRDNRVGTVEDLARTILYHLNSNSKNLMVDRSDYNQAMGRIGFKVSSFMNQTDAQISALFPTGTQVSFSDIFNTIYTAHTTGAGSEIVQDIQSCFGSLQFDGSQQSVTDLRQLLNDIFMSTQIDLMSSQYIPKKRAQFIFENGLYEGFRFASDPWSLFEVCNKFMEIP